MAISATTYTAQLSPSITYATSPLGFVEPTSPLSFQDSRGDHYNSHRKVGKSIKVKSLGERRATGQVVTLTNISTAKANRKMDSEVDRSLTGIKSPLHKASTSSLSSASSSSAATASTSSLPKRHKLSRKLLDNRYEKPQMKTIIERRNSAQSLKSLKLDLDGLDLGGGATQGSKLTGRIEPIAESTGRSPDMNRARTNTFGASTSPSIPAQEEQEATNKGRRGEDSFLAHLRKCQDSNDDYDVNIARSIDAYGKKERQLRIMAGETSIAPLLSAKSINLVDKNGESTPSPCSSLSSDALSLAILAKSPWTTLVPISSDPISTLDIPSIEEMGLHSIDVGSAEDWEGYELSYPCDVCQQIEVAQRTAQWSVARSKKRQRKWIITPTKLAPSRTVVVSDYVSASKVKDDSSSFQEGESTTLTSFSNGGRYSLRFLQIGAGAPNVTIVLASPASHRLQATRLSIKDEEGAATPIAERTNSIAPTSVFDEHIKNTSSTNSTTDEPLTNESNEQWPMIRANATRRDSRKGLTHHRSSSIHATIPPMVNLESRRPSLGKSISHESIFRELSIEAQRAILEEDTTSRNDIHTSTHEEMETLESPIVVGKSPFTPTSFSNYSMGAAPANDDYSSPSRSFDSRNQPFPTMVDPYDTMESPQASMMESTTSRNGFEMAPKAMTPTRSESGWQSESISFPTSTTTTTILSSKLTPKKDRRLSGWIRKKVGANSSGSSGHQPPLPPAWQQTGRLSPLGGSLLVNSRDGHKSSRKHARSNQTKSSASGRSSGYDGSRSGGSDYIHDYTLPNRGYGYGYESTRSTMTSATASPLSSIFSINPEETAYTSPANRTVMMNNSMASRPLAQVYSSQGEYIWPGVMSARGERRRSNSDDNMALMMEAARRRHEALTRGDDGPLASGAASAAITIPLRRLEYTVSPPAAKEMTESDDVTTTFSTSLPAHSVFNNSSFHAFARRRSTAPKTPSILLDLDSVPSDALTMIIPLPLNTLVGGGKRMVARYLRVSFVPFGTNQEDILSGDREGGLELATNQNHHNSSSSTWYKKIAHAWHPNQPSSVTTRNDSQIGSMTDEEGSGLGTVKENKYSSPFPTLSPEQGGNANKLESFKIIAKVLTQPQHHYRGGGGGDSKVKDIMEGLPEPFPFPFILGVCDRKKSVDLIAEGWQSIGLPCGPTEDGPMNRVADLIMAGCVACMDL